MVACTAQDDPIDNFSRAIDKVMRERSREAQPAPRHQQRRRQP